MDLEDSIDEVETGVPHSFFLDDLSMPMPCDYCDEVMWGLSKQGYRCSGTPIRSQFVSHAMHGIGEARSSFLTHDPISFLFPLLTKIFSILSHAFSRKEDI